MHLVSLPSSCRSKAILTSKSANVYSSSTRDIKLITSKRCSHARKIRILKSTKSQCIPASLCHQPLNSYTSIGSKHTSWSGVTLLIQSQSQRLHRKCLGHNTFQSSLPRSATSAIPPPPHSVFISLSLSPICTHVHLTGSPGW